MPQNRKKLIDLLVGNISTAIIHEILIDAVEDKETASYYEKEIENAINISKKYRKKINPINHPLLDKDAEYIKSRIMAKVKSELNRRISQGYKNININLIDALTEKILKNMNIKG